MKAVDIAKQLGISKATVSLALNNKPGVSEVTRRKILMYAQKTEREEYMYDHGTESPKLLEHSTIKVLAPTKGLNLVQKPELDLLPDFTVALGVTAKKLGYTLEIIFPDLHCDTIPDIVRECNDSSAAGIILVASELTREEISYFRGFKKPVVLYDNISENGIYSSVTINNQGASRLAVDYLVSQGIKDIGYFAMSRNIYNYAERRRGFQEAMASHNLPCTGDNILHIGEKPDEIYQRVKNSWHKIHTHEAYIMESYHISVGITHAFRDMGVKIPDEVSLIGIDEIPAYLMGDCRLTCIRVPHDTRYAMTIFLLHNQITSAQPFTSSLSTNCILMEGSSVRRSPH